MIRFDKNMLYLIIAVVLSFVSLAVPMQLNGSAITMFWAAEMVLLLWLCQQSKMNVFRLGFAAIAVLTLISYLMDLNQMSDNILPIISNKVFITGITVTAGFILSSVLLRKEDSENMITYNGKDMCSIRTVKRFVTAVILMLTFIAPFVELCYQMNNHFDSSFVEMACATYITIHAAALFVIYHRKISRSDGLFTVFMLAAIFYSLYYSLLSVEMRYDTFILNYYPSAYFAIHLLSLPAIAWIIYGLARNAKSIKSWNYEAVCWVLVLVSVVILSTELSHAIVMLWSNESNYENLLHDAHTFGYPILWGVLAMLLMLWGLKRKEVVLRKISLFFFGAIILKFYAYDVWRMSQGGRIASFVILGVILLLVSFMQQKIKTLVKDEKQEVNDENKSE
jgi:uncharacterized membrane protein